jgi:regulator of sirC expression with transglutaminase-like and TPR domain
VFKAVNLALTLKQDLGCDYNKELVTSGVMADIRSTQFFRDSSDLFLHGFTEKRKGSCASLPVLMVAVGRRCGYPLYLAASKGHLFCRWEDGSERFNIETAIEGVDSKPDSYYRRWPHPFSDEELTTEKYLKSLSPAEELGVFAQIRAACLQENRRFKEAAQAYETALRAFPESKHVKAYLNNVRGEN